jgi:hypothetical protein
MRDGRTEHKAAAPATIAVTGADAYARAR